MVGPHNSGKTTVAKGMVNCGFFHIETGDIVRQKYNEVAPGISFHDWVRKNNAENIYFFDNFILDAINSVKERSINGEKRLHGIVVTGNRQLDGIKYLMERASDSDNRRNIIIYLDASIEELYSRQLKRKDKIIPNLTFTSFKNEYLAFDEEMGLERIKDVADFILDSGKPADEIFKEVSLTLKEEGYDLEIKNQLILESKFDCEKKIK